MAGLFNVCAVEIGAIETKVNMFLAWLSVVHENLSLRTPSLTLRKEIKTKEWKYSLTLYHEVFAAHQKWELKLETTKLAFSLLVLRFH